MFTENKHLQIGRLPREMCLTDVPLLCMETSYLPLRRFLRSLASKILGLDFTDHHSAYSAGWGVTKHIARLQSVK